VGVGWGRVRGRGVDGVCRERERGVKRFATKSYALHHLETPTGLRFVLTTDPSVADASAVLWHTFAVLWREHVTLNSLQPVGEPLSTPGFGTALDEHVRTLPYFGERVRTAAVAAAAAAAPK
jgi:Sybindin-like family